MNRTDHNNPTTLGVFGATKNKFNNLLKRNKMGTFKLLAFFALVGSVGYAAANNQQSICENPEVESYKQDNTGIPPTLPPGEDPNMLPIGRYGVNFDCTSNLAATCHYVYDTQTETWVRCTGNYVQK